MPQDVIASVALTLLAPWESSRSADARGRRGFAPDIEVPLDARLWPIAAESCAWRGPGFRQAALHTAITHFT